MSNATKTVREIMAARKKYTYGYIEYATHTETEKEIHMNMHQFVKLLSEVQESTVIDIVTKHKTKMINSFGLTNYFKFLLKEGMEDYIDISKTLAYQDALMSALTHNRDLTTATIYKVMPQLKDTNKIFLLTYMFQHDMIPKSAYRKEMVELCGVPILNSKLIGRTYIQRLGQLSRYVYSVFYDQFTGVDNYKTWVGHTATSGKPVQRPNKIYNSFTVTVDIPEKISYLVDVINSGISYNVRFGKKFVTKDNIVSLIAILNDKCSHRKLTSSFKQKIGRSVEQFPEEDMRDLDDFVLKMRSINKTASNHIARKYKKACTGYNAYKKL